MLYQYQRPSSTGTLVDPCTYGSHGHTMEIWSVLNHARGCTFAGGPQIDLPALTSLLHALHVIVACLPAGFALWPSSPAQNPVMTRRAHLSVEPLVVVNPASASPCSVSHRPGHLPGVGSRGHQRL